MAGGNQHSPHWAESLTPEMAKKIAAFVPGFPTKLEDFGDNGIQRVGHDLLRRQEPQGHALPARHRYCEVCHTFKFDFKNQEELMAALGHPEELRKHTISKGITCEECHGAGGSPGGRARRWHAFQLRALPPALCLEARRSQGQSGQALQLVLQNQVPRPAEPKGSQSYNTTHYEKGMRCSTCHDPHEVTANDWKDPYTMPGLKKQCQDCHTDQAAFFAKNNIHGGQRLHQLPHAGHDELRELRHHPVPGLWRFRHYPRGPHLEDPVDPVEKTLNPPPGKDRDYQGRRLAAGQEERQALHRSDVVLRPHQLQ